VLLDSDVLRDRLLRERHPSLSDAPENDSRIDGRIIRLQLENALGQRDGRPHGVIEQRLLRLEMPQNGGSGDTQLTGDVRQGASVEPFLCEYLTSSAEELIAVDDRRPAHL